MPRKLKTYTTTSGFYELAVAAPSMKAALEIWGSKSNLFHQGFAKETDDAAIVNATMANPGIVLRRPVGMHGAFKEHADLPKLSALQGGIPGQPKPLPPARKTAKAKPPQATNPAAARAAAKLYDLAQSRREREEKRADAQREKELKQQADVIEKSEAALDNARALHEKRSFELTKERELLDRMERDEERRWRDQKDRLQAILNRARLGRRTN
jgi:hypothetical protein